MSTLLLMLFLALDMPDIPYRQHMPHGQRAAFYFAHASPLPLILRHLLALPAIVILHFQGGH